jgi:hypothetical protein
MERGYRIRSDVADDAPRDSAEGPRYEFGVASRRLIALAVACAVHAAAMLGLMSVRPPAPVVAATMPDVSEVTLDEVEEPPPAALPPHDAPVAIARSEPPPGTPRPLAEREGTPAGGDRAGETGSTDLVAPATDWSFSPLAAGADPRASTVRDLAVPPASSGSLPSTHSTTGGVAEGLAAKDVALGLGRGGPILAAAEQAARSTDAPMQGGATLEIAGHADGTVAAHVVNADGDSEGWAEVASAIGRSLDPTRVRIPRGRHGVAVTVRLDARVQLADGRDVRSLHGPQVSVAPSVIQSAIEGKANLDGAPSSGDTTSNDPPPIGALGRHPSSKATAGAVAQAVAQRVLPTPTVSVSGKICSASLSVTPFGVGMSGGCSFENIGNGTARVVSGHIVSESPF